MEYPDNFEIPTFPAGKRIAVSRFMAIGVSILFLITIFLCFFILWSSKSQRIDPFLISIDNVTGQWIDVGHSHTNGPIKYTAARLLQESVLGKFTEKWFLITQDEQVNDSIWQTCQRELSCINNNSIAYGENECSLFCLSGEELFSKFIYDVVPDYQNRFFMGEVWFIDKASIQMEPVSQISNIGGTWRIFAKIKSNLTEEINILAFAKIARNQNNYPQTLGYYVADFNAYKIN